MPFGQATGWAKRVRWAALASCGAVVAPLWISTVAAQAPDEIQAIANDAVRRLGLQTELLRAPEPFFWNFHLPPETLWIIVIAGLGVVLYAFRDMIPMFRLNREAEWAAAETGIAGTGEPASGLALGAADDLAAQGRYVEAMHVLLLQALAEIRTRLNEQFADSMTSREILRSKTLSDTLRRPLRDVVNRVEWTYFGEHPAEHDDYVACRSSFSELAHALYGAAA